MTSWSINFLYVLHVGHISPEGTAVDRQHEITQRCQQNKAWGKKQKVVATLRSHRSCLCVSSSNTCQTKTFRRPLGWTEVLSTPCKCGSRWIWRKKRTSSRLFSDSISLTPYPPPPQHSFFLCHVMVYKLTLFDPFIFWSFHCPASVLSPSDWCYSLIWSVCYCATLSGQKVWACKYTLTYSSIQSVLPPSPAP